MKKYKIGDIVEIATGVNKGIIGIVAYIYSGKYGNKIRVLRYENDLGLFRTNQLIKRN